MEKEHSHIDILFTRYFSNEITNEEKEELFQWIESRKENYEYFAELKNIWQLTHSTIQPDDIDLEHAYKRVASQIIKRKQLGFRAWFMRAAAILFIPLLSLSLYLLAEKGKDVQDDAYQKIFVPYGTYSCVELPDSSIVYLNAGSWLEYPLSFKAGKRLVRLEGEGYFEVKADPKNPFIVQTGKLTVTATGTKFQVEDYKTDSIAAVTMKEGIVNARINSQTEINIPAGKRLCLKKNSNIYSLVATDPYKWFAWKDKVMIFRDDPLSYVFKRLSLTFNVEIKIADPRLANHPYRATFEDESLEEILRLLKISAPIVYKENIRKEDDHNSRRSIEVHYTY